MVARAVTALVIGLLLSASHASGAAPAAAPASAPAPYHGLGAESVSKDVLAKFAPPALPPEVSERIQTMLDVRAPGTGQVSPDGKRLFFTWTITGTRQLWRLDGPQRFPVELTGGEDTTLLEDLAPDGSFLLVSRDRGGEENPGVYWQSTEGGPLHVIQHKKGVQTMAEFIADDSGSVVYRANDLKPDSYAIYRWVKKTGERQVLFDQDGLWSVADHQADGRLLLTKELGSSVSEIYEWDPAKKVLTPIIGQGQGDEYAAQYGAAPGEILVQTPKLGEFRRLYSFKGKDKPLTPVTPDLKHDVSSFHIDRARTRLLYTVNEGGYTRLYALDAKTYLPLKLPKLPEADHVFPVSVTRDGRFVTLRVDVGTAPPLGYVLDWKSGEVKQWQLPGAPEVDLTRFVRARLETYPARDGTPIPMLVRRPPQCAEPCPVVVEFHGGPEGQAQPGFSPYAQIFVDAGFVFIEPNVRGSDGYGRTWYHADDGAKRLDIITDIEDCARYVRKAYAKDGHEPKVGILGGSYGGYSSLVGMTMFAGAYDAGVSIVGIGNLVTFLSNTAPYRRALRVNEYGDPEKDKEVLLKLSPVTYVDRVKGPLMIMQGANDPRVPVGEAVQMHQALEARKVVSPLIIFADEGHGSRKRGNQASELGHAVRFLEEQLKAKP
jgi:dipeptidyl aminopeptidase/acylaminoacyl peptidase